MNTPNTNSGRSQSEFLRRLGYYLMGVAMGCVMVGMLWSARSRRAADRAEAAQRSVGQAAPETPAMPVGGPPVGGPLERQP